MAKRDGSFMVLKDLAQKVPLPGLALRYLYLQSNYRVRQNFTMESFLSAYKTLEKLYNIVKSHKIIGENQELQKPQLDHYVGLLSQDTSNNLGNDLNLPAALATVWDVVGNKDINIHTQDEILARFDEVLGLRMMNPPSILENIELSEQIKKLLEQRQQAKVAKDFKTSDELRKQIENLGYELMDTSEGQKVKKRLVL